MYMRCTRTRYNTFRRPGNKAPADHVTIIFTGNLARI